MDDISSTEPVVSVACITYNQEDYIAQCLDSLLAQETSFPFEVLVNDDCSRDGTTDIVLSYQQRYPGKVRAVTHEENQYSQGIMPIENFLVPLARGRYLAMCEGDDYWTDPTKLQRQYDAMQADPTLVACVHANENVQANTCQRITTLRFYEQDRAVDPVDVISHAQCFSTNSLFIRMDAMKAYFASRIRATPDDGDHKMMTFFSITEGGMWYIDRIMSAYRILSKNSINRTTLVAKDRNERALRRYEARVELLRTIDEETDGRYHDAVTKGIDYMGYVLCKDIRDFRRLRRQWPEQFAAESLPTKLDSLLYTYCKPLHKLACAVYFRM